jgi:LmbE family N-acetylglucosaminyl deacetylase
MNILVIAPHADDEILGVGATIAKHIDKGENVYVCIATRGIKPLFDEEYMNILRDETKKAHSLLGIKETFFLEFPAVMLEQVQRYELNGKLSDLVQKIKPDIVYIPHFGDMQRDHQIIAEAAMVAVRPKYEHIIKGV